jgi:DNA-binding NtrC family response regulator
MPDILIMEEDKGHLKQLAEIFIDEGYHVTITDSVASAVCSILKKTAQVVVLGSKCDDLMAADLVSIMRQCNKNVWRSPMFSIPRGSFPTTSDIQRDPAGCEKLPALFA